MIEEEGTVVAIHDGIAEVETVRTSSCTACHAKAACGHHAIAQVSATNRMRVFATDDFSTSIGQEVIIGIPESSLLSASILMYLVPLFGLVLGAMSSSLLSDQAGVAALLSFLGFGTGLLVAKTLSVKYQGNPDFHPRIIGLLQPQIDVIQL